MPAARKKNLAVSLLRRRLEAFVKRRTAFYSLLVLLVGIVISLCAELVANNKPYVLIHEGNWFFPIAVDYRPQEFDWPGIRPDYREICSDEAYSCVFPPIRYDPIEIAHEVDHYPAPPSWEHPMGLDSLGRDIIARMIYGFRVSFLYAVGVWILAFSIGTVIGSCMGFFGGLFDIIAYRFMEIFFSIPYLIVLIILVSVFTPNIMLLIVISSLFSWGHITRYMRSEFLRIRRLDFVSSARASGCTTSEILFRHILPNAITPLVTFSPFFISHGILGLSTLDFLGLGVSPPTPSWGELLHQGKQHFLNAWYLAVFPAVGLFSTLALINFVGEGIRDAFDPRRY